MFKNTGKMLTALGVIALSSVACSTDDGVRATSGIKSASVKSSGNASQQGMRHDSEDDQGSMIKSKALELAEFCKGVNKAPGDYGEEDKIRCDPNIQQ